MPLSLEAAKAEGLTSSTIAAYLAEHSKIPSLLGPTILTKDGNQSTGTLSGKYIGLYFSAIGVHPAAGLRHSCRRPTKS